MTSAALPSVSNHVLRSIQAQPITAEAFRPFGQVIVPQPDDTPFNPQDAQLALHNGTPRFYIMQLHQRGRQFHTITKHGACTQCLGSLEGKDWFLGVAPPSERDQPPLEDIQVFHIPGSCFVKLEVGTWHAGPYFDADTVNFYNLELSDTNVVDHTTCDLQQTYGVVFAIASQG
ncbi:MAG: ureidoglycolate lyase [Cyanobacteria bacterium P01_A01_bin.116]